MADDIALLVRMFGQMDAAGRSEALRVAATAIAAQRVSRLKDPRGAAVDPDDWLRDLASSTYPVEHDAAQLINRGARAAGLRLDAFFEEGGLGTVLCASNEDAAGEGPLAGYRYARGVADDTGIEGDPPDPADYFGIAVDKSDFMQLADTDDGWELDEKAWKAEVDRRCTAEFAHLVIVWRRDFFEALLSGRHPTFTREVMPKPAPTSLSDLSIDDIDRLIDEAFGESDSSGIDEPTA